MPHPRFLLLLLALGACSCTDSSVGYTKFRATDPRGGLIAEWTARGAYYPVTNGYRIHAVERISGPPYMHLSRYPWGWWTVATGAHIEHWHVPPPFWVDQETVTTDFKEVVSTGAVR